MKPCRPRKRSTVRGLCLAAGLLLGFTLQVSGQAPDALIVVGASGEPAYAEAFGRQLESWKSAMARAGAGKVMIVGQDENPSGESDLKQLESLLGEAAAVADRELWIVLIGHATFDGRDARFNLRGPDLSAEDFAAWAKPIRRPTAVIIGTASSSPFLARLSATNRVVVVATRSGYEQNYARFGGYFAEAIADPKADLDRDGQTSILEAFLRASHQTEEFYRNERRLATEHALIDDNGDGFGTPADWFRGTRAVKKAEGGKSLDGLRARQWHLIRNAEEASWSQERRARRDALEGEIETLRESRAALPEPEYWKRLESLLLELAKIYQPPA
ncbi:MAG: hypothetical protein KAX37_04570 [Opitutaceae bacterium]|nr:hypothetical protein [Opitutaceae bacterium]